jgi:hypothetical protein
MGVLWKLFTLYSTLRARKGRLTTLSTALDGKMNRDKAFVVWHHNWGVIPKCQLNVGLVCG